MTLPALIFLDFDGVIMDSMILKLDAYCFALKEYGFSREKIREQQLLYAGLSRSRALPMMYASLAGKSLGEEEKERSLRLFAEEDDRLRPKMRLKPGALEFLKKFHARIPLVVVTGTPQEAIDKTIALFELGSFFREICGHPPVKAVHLRNLLSRFQIEPQKTLFVGDAIQDYKAARETDIPFIGINNGDNPFKGLPLQAELHDLEDLGEWMEKA
jgi:phosphoglycolate phosphatase